MDLFASKLLSSGDTNISNYLLDHFTELGMTPAELVVYLQIKRHSKQQDSFPSAHSIAAVTGYSSQQVYQIFHELMKKKLMKIKTIKNRQGQDCDSYDFALMYEKLANLTFQNDTKIQDEEHTINKVNPTVNDRESVFRHIETEFGRGLSPIELETISQWMDTDNYSPQLILLSLREAVLNQVYNLKYMDRILINWDKRNIRTPAEVEQELQKREKKHYARQAGKYKKPDGPKIPMFKIK